VRRAAFPFIDCACHRNTSNPSGIHAEAVKCQGEQQKIPELDLLQKPPSQLQTYRGRKSTVVVEYSQKTKKSIIVKKAEESCRDFDSGEFFYRINSFRIGMKLSYSVPCHSSIHPVRSDLLKTCLSTLCSISSFQ
jgi:hypothetical protein